MPLPIALAAVVTTLAHAAEPWKRLYDDSKVVSVVVTFVHLASLLVGGGLALAADRATFRVVRGAPSDRERHLAELGLTHRPVIIALAVSFATGVLLFLADVDTFATSLAFWIKMGLVALLLANGLLMTRLERRLGDGRDDDERHWQHLRTAAVLSATLWLTTMLAGVVVTSA